MRTLKCMEQDRNALSASGKAHAETCCAACIQMVTTYAIVASAGDVETIRRIADKLCSILQNYSESMNIRCVSCKCIGHIWTQPTKTGCKLDQDDQHRLNYARQHHNLVLYGNGLRRRARLSQQDEKPLYRVKPTTHNPMVQSLSRSTSTTPNTSNNSSSSNMNHINSSSSTISSSVCRRLPRRQTKRLIHPYNQETSGNQHLLQTAAQLRNSISHQFLLLASRRSAAWFHQVTKIQSHFFNVNSTTSIATAATPWSEQWLLIVKRPESQATKV